MRLIEPRFAPLPSARRLCSLRQQTCQALEIQNASDQMQLLPDSQPAAPPHPSEPVPVLAFAKQLFDLLAAPLRQSVRLPSHSHSDSPVEPAPADRQGCNMRCDAALEQLPKELLMEVTLVGSQARWRE